MNEPEHTLADLDSFQQQVMDHAFYPGVGANLPYTIIAQGGEVGEQLDELKKVMRGKEFNLDKFVEEAGDTLFYLACTAYELGVPLSRIAAVELEKVARIKAEGKVTG